MDIILTRAQWASLQKFVLQGRQAAASLGEPVEIKNGDEGIEIAADEVKITLAD